MSAGHPSGVGIMFMRSTTNMLCPNLFGTFPDPSNSQNYIHCSYGVMQVIVCPQRCFYNDGIKGCSPQSSSSVTTNNLQLPLLILPENFGRQFIKDFNKFQPSAPVQS
ncbi:unnamed protein product [Thelazia callipaeda]|uniref:Chitin-binding type-2 domain-containing protein n=1 Tax=Thelazia callipaeda TaxID=103827 RepID=A0A0N5CT65_THECL|nr:unnamed protein product [Thelazia callipaeda]